MPEDQVREIRVMPEKWLNFTDMKGSKSEYIIACKPEQNGIIRIFRRYRTKGGLKHAIKDYILYYSHPDLRFDIGIYRYVDGRIWERVDKISLYPVEEVIEDYRD